MRRLLSGMAIVATLAASPLAAQRFAARAPLTEREDGRVIYVPRGTVLTVRLEQAAGTNYLWRMVRSGDAVLTAPPQLSDAPTRTAIVGGPQRREFAVRVTGRGRFQLTFRLAPNMLAEGGPTRTVRYMIVTDRDDRPSPRT